MIDSVKKNLKELGFTANEIKIYLALTELGEAPASKVAKKSGLHRTTAISLLNKLAEENYFSTHRYKGVIYYWVESPKVLEGTLENKINIAKQLEASLSEIYRSDANFPFANIYDTKKGIKNFIEKTLLKLKKKSIIYTIDAPNLGNYEKIFSDDFGSVMLETKIKRDVSTKTLVPYGTAKLINPAKLKAQNIVIREMPQGIEFSASIWFVDNLAVMFSGQPPFVVAVHHRIISKSLKSVYDFLWAMSKEIK